MKEKIISQPEELEKLKSRMRGGGSASFLVLADFNKTFTKAFIEGKKVSTSFASIRDNNYLGDEYTKRAKEYFAKYHPIEIDPAVSRGEKNAKLMEWWKIHFELMMEYGITKEVFSEIVNKGYVQLREGVNEFLETMNRFHIPVIIVSSGIGNFIPELLEKENLLFDNVYLYSNMFKFDDCGKAIAISEEIIHTADKRIMEIDKLEYYDLIKDRADILLLGDDLTDLKMLDGFDYENLIKIGFLNENIDSNLEIYKKNFDVVLTGDQDFNYVNKLIEEIIK